MTPTEKPPQTPSATQRAPPRAPPRAPAPAPTSAPTPVQQLRHLLDGIAERRFKRVIVMAGAGISTAAGIPDFRSPKTGLYDNLQRLNLPYPEAVFDIAYLRKRPEAFFLLAEEMYPTQFQPTTFHRLVKWISDVGALKRVYTQNIDTLERIAGVPGDKIVEAHGSFAGVHCIDCHKEADKDEVERLILTKTGKIPRCEYCNGIVKHDIVFFGEALPRRFFDLQDTDFDDVDLAIVAGSSLQVSPFNQLPDLVPPGTPRVLLNLDRVGTFGRRKQDDVLVLGKLEDLDSLFEEYIRGEKVDSVTTQTRVAESKPPKESQKPTQESVAGVAHDFVHELAKEPSDLNKEVPQSAKEPVETSSRDATDTDDAKGSKAAKDRLAAKGRLAAKDSTDAKAKEPVEPVEPAGEKPSEDQVSAVADILTRLGLGKK